MSSANVSYSAKNARRKLLQMLLAAIGVSEKNGDILYLSGGKEKSHKL
jgi:hypothetical protein